MSKAPGSVKDYDGSGGWFKIKDWGANGGQWNLGSTYTFNVPSCVAAGEYLIRIQSLGIHNPWPAGIPQFYVSCAQVKVTGGGSANPPTVSIPGVFKETDTGYTANVCLDCHLVEKERTLTREPDLQHRPEPVRRPRSRGLGLRRRRQHGPHQPRQPRHADDTGHVEQARRAHAHAHARDSVVRHGQVRTVRRHRLLRMRLVRFRVDMQQDQRLLLAVCLRCDASKCG